MDLITFRGRAVALFEMFGGGVDRIVMVEAQAWAGTEVSEHTSFWIWDSVKKRMFSGETPEQALERGRLTLALEASPVTGAAEMELTPEPPTGASA